MPNAPFHNAPFRVRDEADQTMTCNRCRRKIRAGETAIITRRGDMLVYAHADAECPALAPSFPTRGERFVQGSR